MPFLRCGTKLRDSLVERIGICTEDHRDRLDVLAAGLVERVDDVVDRFQQHRALIKPGDCTIDFRCQHTPRYSFAFG